MEEGAGGGRAGWLTLQSWKCSDWMVSWTRWFSCGPTWTDGAEEDTSFRPSSTFLILNFFIFFFRPLFSLQVEVEKGGV